MDEGERVMGAASIDRSPLTPGGKGQMLSAWLHPTPALPIKGRVFLFLGCLPTHKASTSPLVGEVGRGVFFDAR